MLRIVFVSALIAGAAAPAIANAPADPTASNIQSWEAMFSQYPPESVAAREHGAVGFHVKLDPDGFASECRVIQSSGYKRLDDATCQMILDRATFKGLSDDSGRRKSGVTQGVVNWVLPDLDAGADVQLAQASTMPVLRVVEAQPSEAQRQICKRKKVTGTLSGYERVCMTAADWKVQRARIQQEYGELQGSKGSTSGR